MRAVSIASASHKIFTIQLTSNDGTKQDGSVYDREDGASWLLLKTLNINNDIKNKFAVVLR